MTGIAELFKGDTLVPAGLRGYRTWRLLTPAGRLMSVGVHYTWAKPRNGSPEVAVCRAYVPPTPDPHEAPYGPCSCGLYGWYDPEDTRIPHSGIQGAISGVVEASGRTILGTHGFRAQKLRVLAVTAEDEPTRALLRHHGYVVHDTREQMLAAFPPDDMSGLIQHECSGPDCAKETALGYGPAFAFSFNGAQMSQLTAALQASTQSIVTISRGAFYVAKAVKAEVDEAKRRREAEQP